MRDALTELEEAIRPEARGVANGRAALDAGTMPDAAALLLELNASVDARDFDAYRASIHEEIELSSYPST